MGISIRVSLYNSGNRGAWDSLVRETEPGLLLHQRLFMEYHKNIFQDFSLCFWRENSLVAIAPANIRNRIWISHEGLTFGGIIVKDSAFTKLNEYIREMDKFLIANKIEESKITLPSNSFYFKPSNSINFALIENGYELTETHLNQVLIINSKLPSKKISNARSAENKGIFISTNLNFLQDVYEIIKVNLNLKYEIEPVHSLNDITYLCSKFPDQIRIHAAIHEGKVIAGAITLKSKFALHIQYLGASKDGKRLRAQDLLVYELNNLSNNEMLNLSFGKSTSGKNADLNSNLYNFKKEFGFIAESIITLRKNLV